MASSSEPNKVRQLARDWENHASSSPRKLSGGLDEHNKQLIKKGLEGGIGEVQRRCSSSKNSPPEIPPRPRRSVIERTDAAATPPSEEEKHQERGDSGNEVSNEEEVEPPGVVPNHGSEAQELERQHRQAHQKTDQLTTQHEKCEREIQLLNDQICALQEERINLISASTEGRELREELRTQIEELRGKLVQANLREKALREELEQSRQIESDLRKQLAEAGLQAIQQQRDSQARELELERRLHQTERTWGDAASQRRGSVVLDRRGGRQSHESSGFHTRGPQHAIYRRSPDDVASSQDQRREYYDMAPDRTSLRRENVREPERARPQKNNKKRKERKVALSRSSM